MTRAVIPDKGDVISEVCRAVPWVDVLRLVDIINCYHRPHHPHHPHRSHHPHHRHHLHHHNHDGHAHLYAEVLMRQPLVLLPHIPLTQSHLHPMRLSAEKRYFRFPLDVR